MKVKAPKFSIGDSVKNKDDGEVGVITAFSFDPSSGYHYQTTSKEVDITAKEVINGYKTVGEDEIETSKVESTHNPDEHGTVETVVPEEEIHE